MHCCFSTVSVVTPTCHNVTLYVHCLACYIQPFLVTFINPMNVQRISHTINKIILNGSLLAIILYVIVEAFLFGQYLVLMHTEIHGNLHFKLRILLSEFNQDLYGRQYLVTLSTTKFQENRFNGSGFVTCVQTDRQTRNVSFLPRRRRLLPARSIKTTAEIVRVFIYQLMHEKVRL